MHVFMWLAPFVVALLPGTMAFSPRIGMGWATRRASGRRCAAASTAAAAVVVVVMVGAWQIPCGAALSVGVLYEGWHGFATQTLVNITARGGAALTVEGVLASSGNLTLNDMLNKYGAAGAADNFYFQAEPAAGFYCIYDKRPSEPTGWIPDCSGINATLARHAAQLTAAGVDFVVVDSTNLPTLTEEADVIQVRPQEVLFETWASLRSSGTPTPAITAWQTVPPGGTLWQNALALYNAYPDLVFKDPGSGKMLFFVPSPPGDGPDPGIVAAIEANGGGDNVTVVPMWAEFGSPGFATGMWAFFSPCVIGAGASAVPTSSVVGLGRGATPCGQLATTGSAVGSALAVSPSYQMSYGSLPFTAAGKFDGLTLKRQFGTLLAAAAAGSGGLPDYVFLSSWNEWISQPQPNPYGSPYAFSMGLPDDAMRADLWVDSYGSSLSRDLEPSTTYGTQLYDIMASCLRVARSAAADYAAWQRAVEHSGSDGDGGAAAAAAAARLDAAYGTGGGRRTTSCTAAGEVCCTYNETTDGYAASWALTLNGGGDALLTYDTNEVAHLTCPGCGWAQTCNAYAGPTDFCIDAAIVSTPAALSGPFVLHSAGCGSATGQYPSPSASLPGRAPLYRCRTADNVHAFGSAPGCGVVGATTEQVLGCMDTTRSSNMPRGLRGCTAAAGGFMYHVLDGGCAAGDADGGILGFVH